MTVTESTAHHFDGFELFAVDLYRDIHKGIRAELFAVVESAGRLDPLDASGRQALTAHVEDVAHVLRSHAEHEDRAVQPVLEQELPALADKIEHDHAALERKVDAFTELAASFVDPAAGDERRLGHFLYLELASFTAEYLTHQDVEERLVMPALDRTIGVEAAGQIHHAIVSSIPPDEMARSLAFMLPAMNIDGRAELLGGMQANAPAEAFAGVWDLTGSVLEPADRAALAHRLGL